MSGKVASAWSFGTTWSFWVLVLLATFVVLMAARGWSRPRADLVREGAWLAAALLGAAGIDVVVRAIPAIAPYANVVSASAAVGLIAGIEKTPPLGLLGAGVVVVAALAHSFSPVELLPGDLSVPIPAMMDVAAGAALVVAAVALRAWNGTVALRRLPESPPLSRLAGG